MSKEKAVGGRRAWSAWRYYLILFVIAPAWILGSSKPAIQLAWGLQCGLPIAVSIIASCWWLVGGLNLSLALLWLWPSARMWLSLSFSKDSAKKSVRVKAVRWLLDRATSLSDRVRLLSDRVAWLSDLLTRLSDAVTWLNRQAGHLEAGATWIAVVIVWSPILRSFLPPSWFPLLLLQVSGIVIVAVFGKSIINWVATRDWLFGKKATKRRHDEISLIVGRRLLIYMATFIGISLLVAAAWSQWLASAPLLVAFLPVLVARALRFLLDRSLERSLESSPLPAGQLVRFHEVRRQRAERTYKFDWASHVVLVLAMAGFAAWLLWERHALAAKTIDVLDGLPPPKDACLREPGGPVKPTLALFLVGDTHVHEIKGHRVPAQMEVANLVMPVSRRPVELDILSGAPIAHFARVYQDIVQERKQHELALARWAHLGDFSDLSCLDEMGQTLHRLKGYDLEALAGYASGSHDMSFQGNFDWAPDWDKVCPSAVQSENRRMDKATSDKLLRVLLEGKRDITTSLIEGWDVGRLGWGRPLARVTVAKLGTLPAHQDNSSFEQGAGPQRGVLAVFFDTTDRGYRNRGVAGAFGTFSARQATEIYTLVGRAKNSDGPWADPWIVLLGHSPYRSLTSPSRQALGRLIEDLDRGSGTCKFSADDCQGPRVLGMLAAHTHTAESHRHCIGHRLVRELVIGSTLDAPEQAALLEIGLDHHDRASMRISTLASVARPGLVCSRQHAIPATRCHQVIARMTQRHECSELVGDWNGHGSGTKPCEDFERPLTLGEKVDGLATYAGPDDPTELEESDKRRSRALIRCLCRNADIGNPGVAACAEAMHDPLADEKLSDLIQPLAQDPDRRDELTCLAWAASAAQSHKANGMTFADALRCAFDDPSLQPEQVTTATAEVTPCD